MDERDDRVPIGRLPCGCGDGDWGNGRRRPRGLWPNWFGRPGPSGVGLTVRPTCGLLGMANAAPAAQPNGNAVGGFGPDAEGMGDMPARRCSGNLFRKPVPENFQRSVDHPENARSILSLRKRLGLGWALGGHPETSAHPGVEWTPFPAAIHIGPLRPIDGLFDEKMQLACATGPAGDGEELPRVYSGLPTFHYGRALQAIRR